MIVSAVAVIGALALAAVRGGAHKIERSGEIDASVAAEAAPNIRRSERCVYAGKTYEPGCQVAEPGWL